jgi:hypothetical protein
MKDESHAQHRPPFEKEPAQAMPPTSFGQLYPENDILAVIEDRTVGNRVLQALGQAGVPEGDMDIIDPAWFLEAGRAFEERRGLLQRLAALVAMEEGIDVAEYKEEAARGHPIIAVHAGGHASVESIREVLRRHGAGRIRYYRRNTIEDL